MATRTIIVRWGLLAITIGWWAWVGFRVLALTTNALGPVAVHWSLNRPTSYAAWTGMPSDAPGIRTLPAHSSSSFTLKPPNHARYIRIRIYADSSISLDDENRNTKLRNHTSAQERVFDRYQLVTIFGRYRFTLRNTGTTEAVVRSMDITWQP